MIRTALVSVSDKSNLELLVPLFKKYHTRVLSTGNTAVSLEKMGLTVEKVSDFTGYPEILGGRVKSLHPKIYAGILCDSEKPDHRADLQKVDAPVIDLVVCNLYPFKQTVARPDCTVPMAIENIDVGGPSMIRAAAKNFKQVCVLVSGNQYAEFVQRALEGQALDQNYRFQLAAPAFEHTAEYDDAIQLYFKQQLQTKVALDSTVDETPNNWHLKVDQSLRYGENPHQAAKLYQIAEMPAGVSLKQLHGKEISYNNILDFEASLNLWNDFGSSFSEAEAPFWVGIFKHLNPCGIGLSGVSLTDAYYKAFEFDSVSPFGGILIANKIVTSEFVTALGNLFLEAIIAPAFEDQAFAKLAEKKNIRLMLLEQKRPVGGANSLSQWQIRSTHLGLLVQQKDQLKAAADSFKVVTKRQPNNEEMQAMKFAWLTVKQLRSNAIAFTSAEQTIGIGIGQTNRVQSLKIALQNVQLPQAANKLVVCASDAFFPFSDSIEQLKNSPVKAIIQPGGSVRDQEVIEACDRYGMTMLFTGERHFTH